jgi:ribosomal subunit interface protein
MQYQITSDNIEMSPSMEALAHEKTKKLEQKVKNVPDDLKTLRVVMNSAPEDRFEAKILFTVRKHEYYAEANEYTLESALVKAVDDLERMLEKDKDFTTEQSWEEAREAKRLTEETLEKATDAASETPLEEA